MRQPVIILSNQTYVLFYVEEEESPLELIRSRFSVGVTLAAACLAGAAQAAEPTLARNLAANCTSCHGTHGASASGMRSLAGQPQPALLAALRAFRDGSRPATVMHQLARGYTDQQLEALAAFFSAQSHQEDE